MEKKRSKYLLIGLTVICILLIGITSIKDGVLEPLRTGVGYVLVPLQTGVNAVGRGIYNGIRDYTQLKDALEENESLKEDFIILTRMNFNKSPIKFQGELKWQLLKIKKEINIILITNLKKLMVIFIMSTFATKIGLLMAWVVLEFDT